MNDVVLNDGLLYHIDTTAMVGNDSSPDKRRNCLSDNIAWLSIEVRDGLPQGYLPDCKRHRMPLEFEALKDAFAMLVF